jgi:hypothetical protein
LRIAEDFAITDEEFEVTFEYMQYLMGNSSVIKLE